MNARRCLIVVLDGLGIGETPDVETVRPQDIGASSLVHALEHVPAELPALTALGLRAAMLGSRDASSGIVASWGSAALAYRGADSYRGHLELMGADTSGISESLLRDSLTEYEALLVERGHAVDRVGPRGSVLMIDDAMCLHDSLEADPGLNYNVTGSLLRQPFERIVAVAQAVRERAPVNRVIAVGGVAVTPEDIVGSIRERDGVEGVDTPALGVYKTGVVTRHFGFPLPPEGQLPNIAVRAGADVTLIGKAADLLECEDAVLIPAVETDTVFDAILGALIQTDAKLLVANVQELDLAGHQHEPAMYVDVLKRCDARLSAILPRLGAHDCLIVTGDHGNDSSRSTGHTRERVPVLLYGPSIASGWIGDRSTLSDVGATAADWLGLPPPSRGTTFLPAASGLVV